MTEWSSLQLFTETGLECDRWALRAGVSAPTDTPFYRTLAIAQFDLEQVQSPTALPGDTVFEPRQTPPFYATLAIFHLYLLNSKLNHWIEFNTLIIFNVIVFSKKIVLSGLMENWKLFRVRPLGQTPRRSSLNRHPLLPHFDKFCFLLQNLHIFASWQSLFHHNSRII